MSERIVYYDNLKLGLIFLVIFGHFCGIAASSSAYGRIFSFYTYTFHMPLFVFAAGLLCNVYNPDKTKRRVIGFILKYILMKGAALLARIILRGDVGLSLFSESGIPLFMLGMSAWTCMAYATRDYKKTTLLIVGVIT